MKIIISKATMLALSTQADQIVFDLTGERRAHFGDVEAEMLQDTYTNHRVELIDGEYILTINDEGLFKYMAVYLKIARAIKPFIAPVMNLLSSLKSDMKDIERFLNQRKSTHAEDVAAWDEARRVVDNELTK